MEQEKPPILETWNRVYALVIGVLLVLIVLFYFFADYFG
ncbi:MAG: hypothetical protein K0S12_2557 [Bacteroidetes bacterium]|jgi:hypothetical protein|nr:hypothetical protein [Bacteroidota bacterium]